MNFNSLSRSNSLPSLARYAGTPDIEGRPGFRTVGRAPQPVVPDNPEYVAGLKAFLKQTAHHPIDHVLEKVPEFVKAQLAAAEVKAKREGTISTLKASDLPQRRLDFVMVSGQKNYAAKVLPFLVKEWDDLVKKDPSRKAERHSQLMKASVLAGQSGLGKETVEYLVGKAHDFPERPERGDRPVGRRASTGSLAQTPTNKPASGDPTKALPTRYHPKVEKADPEAKAPVAGQKPAGTAAAGVKPVEQPIVKKVIEEKAVKGSGS